MKKALFIAWIVLTILWAVLAVANIVAGESLIRIAYSICATALGGLYCYTEWDRMKKGG